MKKKEIAIKTERLNLRRFEKEDAKDVYEYAKNENVSRYTTWKRHKSIEDAIEFVDMVLNYGNNEYCWAIRLNGEEKVVGAIEFGLKDQNNGDIHYVLAQQHWGKGLMTEAVRAILKWAFDSMPSLQCITTSAMTQNIASTRVMQKSGMLFQFSHLEKWDKFDSPIELSIYSISRDLWLFLQ